MRLGWLVAVLLALVSVPAWAAQVQLVVPYRSLEVGQQGQADLVVINGRTSAVPTLPADDGLAVRYVSQTRGSRVVNTTRTTTIAYTYTVRAVREGRFRIGPVTVTVDGQDLTAPAVEIEVVAPPPEKAEGLVATASLKPESAWEGQVVLYTYGLRSKLPIARAGWVSVPVTRLTRPREGAPVRRQYEIDDPGGAIAIDETTEPFVVTAGVDLDLEPAVLQVEIPVDDPRGRMRLFQPTETRTVQTPALRLDVRPLPPAPPGFSGLVGDFVFDAVVDGTEASVGESVDWTVTARGDGSLEGFSLPPSVDRPDVRFYDGSPVVQAEIRDDTYRAFGQFKRVIVPTEAGRLDLRPLEIVTFSPSEGRYVTHTLEIPPLDVVPGREGGGEMESFAPADAPAPVAGPEPVDVYPVMPTGRARSFFVAPWLLAGAALAAALGLGVLALDARDAWRRRHPEVETPVHRPRATDPLGALDESLREALARMGGPSPGLPEGLAERVADARRALDRARFAGEDPGPDLAERVHALVADLGRAK